MGHKTCQYLEFETTLDGQPQKRYYHPMSKVSDTGFIDLLIKVYLRNFQNQQGGLFTQHIDKMREGDTSMRITAIGGDITYEGDSVFEIRNSETKQMEARRIKRVGMISAGSGIAPMYQLTQTVADSNRDLTSLSLIYSNRTPVSAIFTYKNVVCF